MSVLSIRCGKSTCDFVWEGPPSELNKATAEHRRAVAQAKATMDAAAGAVTTSSDAGNTAPEDKHRPVVVGERWTWLKGYSIFNFAWIVMSVVAYGNMSTGWFFLFLIFPQVATSVAQPVVPIVVMIAAVCTATGYGMQRVKGAEFWPRFFASLTLFGAISAMVSAGIGIVVPLLLLVLAQLL
ncbi:hypothetical protein [Microbacterium sp. Leaf151]|uniref:hypothetical protein n=1 Tax=Microbacterium sp. Leaf151 TaxID=1736276 RepID=UPI0006FD8E05|nr:hypothetical protein [Microbacterium sp. Leaf151]KQR26105.1 hypothetical protein ASF76_02235 [Microbacterium sp. Leaf151]